MTQKIAGLYIRTSTEDQAKSIDIQCAELEKFCKLKDYEIFDKYVDFGYSGKNTDRPEFKRLIKDASDKKINVVVVTKIDRFARSIVDCLVNVELLESYGVSFVTSTQCIDTNSSMGKLTLQIMSAFAEFERTIILERMETGRKAAEREGVICHRPRKEINSKKLIELIDKKMSANACAKFFSVNTNTITTRMHEMGYTYINGVWDKKL